MVQGNYTKIPNAFFDKLMKGFTPSELKVLLIIYRKTIGFQKEWDKISLSQFEEVTGGGRGNINKALKGLEEKGFIQVDRSGYSNSYKVNADSSETEPVPNQNQGSSETKPKQFRNGTGNGSETEHTKEKKETLKENIQKKYTPRCSGRWDESQPIDYSGFVDRFNEIYSLNGKSALRVTDKKRGQIRGRLKVWTAQEIINAWKNRTQDEWLNSEGKKYLSDWEAAMRNDEKIERYQTVKNEHRNGKINTNKLQRQLTQAFEEE